MKTLPFILFIAGVILAVASLMSTPNEMDYQLHTDVQAMTNSMYLLVLAVLSIAGAIILSLGRKEIVI